MKNKTGIKVDKSFTDVQVLPSWATASPVSIKEDKPKPRGPRMTLEKAIPGLKEKKVGDEFLMTVKVALRGVRTDENERRNETDYELEVLAAKVG